MGSTEKTLVELERQVKELLTPERFEHTVGVRDTSVMLARMHGADTDRAAIGALLHDIARDLPSEELFRIIEEHDPGVLFNVHERRNPVLLHAAAGAILARTRFHIRDEEILRCIERHTAGAPGMGLLERIIFVADFIEPGRDMEGVKEARDLATSDLSAAMLCVLKSILYYLLREDRYIITDAIEAYNEILSLRGD
jgi:predicted HD superfamily hydrolase involved in NAD metabolism